MAEKKNVFLFSGQGSQTYNMHLNYYSREPQFRDTLNELNKLNCTISGTSVIDFVFDDTKKNYETFSDILISHPAIFLFQYAFAKYIIHSGLKPDVLMGASLGEYVALTLAGIIEEKDAFRLINCKAQLINEKCEKGRMVAILANKNIFYSSVLKETCELALENNDNHFVVSVSEQNINEVTGYLRNKVIGFQVLPVEYGFHSSSMDIVKNEFIHSIKDIAFHKPHTNLFSSLKTDFVEKISVEYLWDIAREKIDLYKSIRKLSKKGNYNYINSSPSGALANFVKYNLGEHSENKVYSFSSVRNNISDYKKSTNVLKKLIDQTKLELKNKKMKAFIFPGQGSQKVGMGKDLFSLFQEYVEMADKILGYSVEELCLYDKKKQLVQTQFTQPVLFLVNALSFLHEIEKNGKPDIVAGHSLGEYNALCAAGAFDIETGLKLVQKRGELMAQAKNGGMAAVVGMNEDKIKKVLTENGLDTIDIANYNTPSQIVISGISEDIKNAQKIFESNDVRMYTILRVGGAFHSRYMKDAQEEYSNFIGQFSFNTLNIPVISNVTASEYTKSEIAHNLINQLASPVRWSDTIRYIMGFENIEFQEIGPGNVQTNIIKKIQQEATPIKQLVKKSNGEAKKKSTKQNNSSGILPETLGDTGFKTDYNLKYAYYAGSMYKGIASKELVIRMGENGLMGFLGSGGLKPEKIENDIIEINKHLATKGNFGVNILYHPEDPSQEDKLVNILIKHKVKNIEASAFMQITPALIKYKGYGLVFENNRVETRNKIIAKVSRPEIAEMFLSPAPEKLINQLIEQKLINKEQAGLLKQVPVADDICVESDSGGHTDMGMANSQLPTIIELKNAMMQKYSYKKNVRVGAAGGLGTPQSAASAFILGADFLVTGSINQCSAEAATSDLAKELLQQMNIQDTDYAPAGDMFELGAKVQVLKKGLFFPARANKLHELYKYHSSIDDIDQKLKKQIQERYFKRSFNEVYEDVKNYFANVDPATIKKAEKSKKHKMALIFRWYFNYSTELALNGVAEDKVNFQIHCGPSLGAFNQYVKGSEMENWKNRHVDRMADKIMIETAEYLNNRFSVFIKN